VARSTNDARDVAKKMGGSMSDWVLIRRTNVLQNVELPRPKKTQDVICIGPKDALGSKMESLMLLPENQSTDLIEVKYLLEPYTGQHSHTSARPGNGTR
jgi:hypothetical protein